MPYPAAAYAASVTATPRFLIAVHSLFNRAAALQPASPVASALAVGALDLALRNSQVRSIRRGILQAREAMFKTSTSLHDYSQTYPLFSADNVAHRQNFDWERRTVPLQMGHGLQPFSRLQKRSWPTIMAPALQQVIVDIGYCQYRVTISTLELKPDRSNAAVVCREHAEIRSHQHEIGACDSLMGEPPPVLLQ